MGQIVADPLQRAGNGLVECRQEQAALVAECLIEAAARQPGALGQILDRGAVIAAQAKHLGRVAQRVVQIELAGTAGAGAVGKWCYRAHDGHMETVVF